MLYFSRITRSSNGRTAGFGPVNRGSSPCRVAKKKNAFQKAFFFFATRNKPTAWLVTRIRKAFPCFEDEI